MKVEQASRASPRHNLIVGQLNEDQIALPPRMAMLNVNVISGVRSKFLHIPPPGSIYIVDCNTAENEDFHSASLPSSLPDVFTRTLELEFEFVAHQPRDTPPSLTALSRRSKADLIEWVRQLGAPSGLKAFPVWDSR